MGVVERAYFLLVFCDERIGTKMRNENERCSKRLELTVTYG